MKALLIPLGAVVKVVHLDADGWREQVHLALGGPGARPLPLTTRWQAWAEPAHRPDKAACNHRATWLARSYGALHHDRSLHGPVLITGLNPAAGAAIGLADAQIEAIRRRTDELN